jgi:hypothetical protein
MRVDIDKQHIDSYKRIVNEANKAAKKAPLKVKKEKYEKLLIQQNLSAESKKKRLMSHLHKLIISSFSIDKNKIHTKKFIENFRANTELIRYIIQKLKAINNYLEDDLLRDLGIVRKSLLATALKTGKPITYLEKKGKVLSEDHISKIEHTIYKLMDQIVIFDKKLLKGYKIKKVNIVTNEKLGIKDLKSILEVSSELLEVLEAKIPPPDKIKAKLFSKNIFNLWAPMVLALLASLETEYKKETIIFSKIKKNEKLKALIENKIKHIVEEKERVLKIRHERAVLMNSTGKISDAYRQKFHEYVNAASL